MKYITTMFVTVFALTLVACGDKEEDTGTLEDTSALEAAAEDAGDASDSEDNSDEQDGGSSDE